MVNLQRDMIQGLVRVRILDAASLGPVSGVELSEDLAAADHKVSPGTLYPLLHAMEKSGWLKSHGKTVKGKHRRYYRLTKKGQAQLRGALEVLSHFMNGILEPLPVAVRRDEPNGFARVDIDERLPSRARST